LNAIKRKITLFLYDNYYLFWAAGLTAGIYAGDVFNLNNAYQTAAEIVAVAALMAIEIIAVLGNLPEKNPYDFFITSLVPCLILFLAGILITGTYSFSGNKNIISAIYENENLDSNNGTPIIIEGRVSEHPSKSYGNLNFTMAVDRIFVCDSICESDGNQVSFLKVGETINVRIKNATDSIISRDDYLAVRGSFKKNDLKGLKYSSLRNNNDNNTILFTSDYCDVKKAEPGGPVYKIFAFRSRFYECLRNAFYRNLGSENACIAEAVILGDRNNLPPYTIESFKRCGIYHLFAISGLHLSFFTSLIYLIFKRRRSSNYVLVVVIIFLAGYNFLVGERASMLRASIAVILINFAGKWHREYSHKIILFLSYIILIIYNPYFIYNPGFWMTFSSMAALAFIYTRILKITENIFICKSSIFNYYKKIILITLSTQVVLLPVLIYFFNEVSLISPLANIMVIPIFYILLATMIFSSFIIIIWPPAAVFPLKLSGVLFKYILKTVDILSRLDYCIVSFNDVTAKKIAILYTIFLFLLFMIYISVKVIKN
jgi:competence protein ComEC